MRMTRQTGGFLSYVMVLFITMAAGWTLSAQVSMAVQKETQTEKEANLKGQALGQLFNRWTFDQQKPDESPSGFSAFSLGEGPLATWILRTDAEAPSAPNILHASSACASSTCSQLLVASGFEYEYPDVSVRLRLPQDAQGGVGGLAFGVRDAKNFYAALADLGAQTVTVIRVFDGQETVLGQTPITSKAVAWHSLRVQRNTIISKDFIETVFDGQMVLSVRDQMLGIGQVGLVVRGKSTLHFDSLHAIPLFSQRPLSPPAAY